MNALPLLAAIVTMDVHAAAMDLDRPGALDALKAANPDHYRRAIGIIDASFEMSCQVPEFDRFIRARYEATRTACGALVKTSLPPQRLLSFRLDGVDYSKTAYFDAGGKVRHADERRGTP